MNTYFVSHSQAGQDRFVAALCGDTPGTFLDIGMNHPSEKNNTYALEKQLGWRGIVVEQDEYCCKELFPKSGRTGSYPIWGDATRIDWKGEILRSGFNPHFTYLSLDVDEASLATLANMPLDWLRFDIITVEHDAYSRGDRLRAPMRAMLQAAGYVILASDVCDRGMRFEDWAVSSEMIIAKYSKVSKFISDGREWSELFPK